MTDNNPVPDTGATSTAPDTNAIVSNLDAQIDAMFDTPREPIEITADLPPEKTVEVDDDVLEGSTEDDATVEGASDTDADEVEATANEDLEDTSEIVDWEEMKDFSYQINGKTYSANDLKAALGRQTKQAQARTEVEEDRSAVEKEKTKLAEMNKSLKIRKDIIQHEANLTSFGNQIKNLERQREQARQAGNVNAYTQIGMRVDPMVKQYHQARKELDNKTAQNTSKNLEIQKDLLNEKGYGDVIADKQRRNALSSYIAETYSETTLGEVTMSAEMIILAEKARLYDKAHSGSKAKLKGSGKTLKGGATKSRSKSKQPVDKIQSQIDEMFKDYM